MHVFNLYLLLSLFKFLGRYRYLLLSHLNDDTISWDASRPMVSSNQKFLGSPVPCELGILDSLPEDALLFWSGPFEMSLLPAVLVLHFQRLREREQWQVLGTIPHASSSTLIKLARGWRGEVSETRLKSIAYRDGNLAKQRLGLLSPNLPSLRLGSPWSHSSSTALSGSYHPQAHPGDAFTSHESSHCG